MDLSECDGKFQIYSGCKVCGYIGKKDVCPVVALFENKRFRDFLGIKFNKTIVPD
jgi:hypothetical protein